MELHLPRGTAANGPWALEVPSGRPGWEHTSLRVLELPPEGEFEVSTGEEEMLIVPLAGEVQLFCDKKRTGYDFWLPGRESPFERVTGVAYLPRDSRVTVMAGDRGGRYAFAGPWCHRQRKPVLVNAEDITVEVRGAGQATRQVNSLCMPGGLDAERLLVCEVLTPGGNWSSFPPHKHDSERPGLESQLEEIYYFELARPGLAYHRVYGTEERPIDVLAEVGDGDVVLVPHGWHGPSIAAPGVDLYYLNVMAGPGLERAWLICDDPAHTWVRGTWLDQECDPRVPMTSAAGRIPR
jgi:5-deoxy-glucuronate isomerase